MTMDRYSPEQQKSTALWRWSRNGLTRELAPPDKAETALEDFRAQETKAILKELHSGKRLVIVRVNSAYGVTRFLVPALKKALAQKEISFTFADVADELPSMWERGHGSTLIVDEIGQSDIKETTAFLHEKLQDTANLQVVVLFDSEARPEYGRLIKSIAPEPAFIEVKPKVFNQEQAIAYLIDGPPTDDSAPRPTRDLLKYTFLEGLNRQQITQIVSKLREKYPLHFHVLDALKSLNQYVSDRDETLKTFEDRLKEIESTSSRRKLSRAMEKTGLEQI